MTIAAFIDEMGSREKTLTVFNEDEPEPLIKMLEEMVDAPDVELRDGDPPADGPGNVVVLEDGDGSDLAISAIDDVGKSVLMVNSDLYITGTRSLEEVDTPEVLVNLDETTFTVDGKQKMLLIEISRHIEALAHRTGDGELHSGFQYLSRIEDERGTRRVYDRLGDSGVAVHVYGVPDRIPDLPGNVSVHADDGDELRHSWFVVHTDCPPEMKAALVAREVGDNEWRGFWTFDADITDEVTAYLTDRYPA